MRTFIDNACSTRGSSPFVMFRGLTWSYADAGAITDALAAELLAIGLAPGDRLAMRLPTGPEHLFLWLATAKAGIVSCPLHVDLAPPEVEAALAHLRPRGFVDVSGSISLGGAAVARLDELLLSRRPFAGVDTPNPAAIATILTTSGTTGRPKSAMLSHGMAVLTGEAFAHWLALSPSDRLFTCLPLSHINARFYSTLGAIGAGASLAIEERFSASRFWSWVRGAEATQVNAIGAMLRVLLDRAPTDEDRAHGLRLVYAAPALGREAHLAFERRFGTRLVIGYGLTESTFGFIQPLGEPGNLDAMGLPRRHPDPSVPAEVKLVDGEVWLRNSATFSGYFEDEATTRETLTADGWLKTGDLATRGIDGSYTFVGRKKLVIRRRGEMLTPEEVERAIEEHPAVLEAGVVGVPSPLGEEDVLAFVVLKSGLGATESELTTHCAARLAAFKVPSRWRFLDALPRTATQRIAYDLLKRGR